MMSKFEEIERQHPVSEDEFFRYLLDSKDNRMQEIMPGLWLGNQIAAGGIVPLSDRTPEFLDEALSTLQEKGVTHILCLAEDLCVYPDNFVYLKFRIADQSSAEGQMYDFFDKAFDFIESAVSNGGKVLVHCNAGMSRSATVVISYLMKKNNLSYFDAVVRVRSIRKCINTREFESALLRLEESHNSQRHLSGIDVPPYEHRLTRRHFSRALRDLPNNDIERENAKLAQLENSYPAYHAIIPGQLLLGTQVVAGLGVPDLNESEALETIKSLGISHIVNCTGDGPRARPFEEEGVQYYCASLPHRVEKSGQVDEDGSTWADLSIVTPEAVAFIDDAISAGGLVYVHCNNGENRSAAVVTAYLMHRRRWGFDKAYMHVRGIRVVVNTKLDEYLLLYETQLAAVPDAPVLQFWEG